jgi:DNA-binding NtrC family response regulator
VVDDERGVRTLCADLLVRAGYEPVTCASAEEALELTGKESFDVVLADVHLGGLDGIELCKRLRAAKADQIVILITAYPSIENAVHGMKEGARDYVTKPFSPDELRIVVARALEERALRRENAELRDRLAFGEIIGHSRVLDELLRTVEKVARADATVLIVGESGTGKELFARAIHFHGPRAARPFVAVNCGALVGTLLESELFGHVRGAFTGAASAKRGLFVAADRGTLFLDEIGELAPELQPKLLRALQEGEIKPVGGLETQKVDVRVVAATNRDLREDVRAGRFREDLYYRLNVITLEIPPLRERPEDIPPLCEHFVKRAATRARKPAPEISAEAMAAVMALPWPGNVRELANAVERAVVLGGEVLVAADFAGRASPRVEAAVKSPGYPFLGMSLEEVERMHIERVLGEVTGQKGRAAEILGINRTTLWKKLRQYGYE